jgi:hypothetical protein
MRIIFIICGVCWFGFAIALCIFFPPGADGGTGWLQAILALPNSSSLALGLVHLLGFIALVFVCLGIGLSLLLRGLFPKPSDKKNSSPSNHSA